MPPKPTNTEGRVPPVDFVEWPNGSQGPKRAEFCITCGLLEVRPDRTCFNEGKEAEYTDVEVIPLAAVQSLEDSFKERVREALLGKSLALADDLCRFRWGEGWRDGAPDPDFLLRQTQDAAEFILLRLANSALDSEDHRG